MSLLFKKKGVTVKFKKLDLKYQRKYIKYGYKIYNSFI